jgi:antitoxin ParD1/3/4
MATRTTLNVSLPVELGRLVEDLVRSGHYASASEVVREGLRLLRDRRVAAQFGRDPLRNEKAVEGTGED